MKLNTSRRLLSLLVGSLLAVESTGLHASDDELLMFVESSQPAPAPVAAKPASRGLSAQDMAALFAKNTKPAAPIAPVKKPVAVAAKPSPAVKSRVTPAPAGSLVTPAPLTVPSGSLVTAAPSSLPSEPLLENPIATVSATPDKPLQEQASPFAPAAQSDQPAPVSEIARQEVRNDLPVFVPASSLPAASTAVQPRVTEPQLTPQPRLNVASTPANVARSSPGELELRGIFYRAVLTALERSPQVRSTQLQVDAAKEDVSNAKGQRWPQVDVNSNTRRYEFGQGNRNGSTSNLPSFGVSMATNLIDFGQTSNTIKSKEFSVKAADYQNSAQVADLAWQVSSGLVELSKQRLIIEMSKQYVARMQELVAMLSGIVSADAGRRSELTQATGRFLQAQSALDNAVSKARDTEIALYRLIGETQVPLPASTQWQLNPSQLNALLAQVDNHPALKQAQAQTQASFAEADALKSSSLPKINWVVSKDTGKDSFGREQAWQTGINVSWGLFRGGSAQAAELAAVQRASSMREQAQNQRDDLEQRIRAADQDAHSMLQRADLYRNLTRESDRIRLDFFDQWYHLGKRTLLDVLTAESDYYGNRVGEVTNRFDGYSAIFRGYASAGELVNWLKNAPMYTPQGNQ